MSTAVTRALRVAGVPLVPLGPETDGIVWLGFHDPVGLRDVLEQAPGARWVQLPSAGVDDYARAGVLRGRDVIWTSAKGAYSRPVAEHALALILAMLRHLPERARAGSWGEQKGTSLHGQNVVIVGAGGVTRELLRLLEPFGANSVIVRRRPDPLPGATRTVTQEHLRDELGTADIVVLAAALTPDTRFLIGQREIATMRPDAILVNVARGALVDTKALVDGLADGRIGGAALDVTHPEPLPDGHPLWSQPRALITPHSADTTGMIEPLLRERVVQNALCFVVGDPLEGIVDPELGY
ncbi:D-isomer specific 2-hydroxyacid dehydrogenase family protein [Puerhibacterium puerhi]|uniref:D-isomer specific 2-hydroxyacid dehydrogenase family protein n=1 Tax=Puerhibacterium puerhi TaxID=2692623 RepID=UPI0019151721|nr:D-isomer specific 2-hydroxyacid dehydrogenase family protein [Puerhibacterium puerhi]